MRITIPVVSNGNCWYPKLPKIDISACYPRVDSFDEDEFRRQIRDIPQVQVENDDRGTVMAFAAVLIDHLNAWMEDNRKEASPATDKIRSRMQRRIDRGTYTYCRITLHPRRFEHAGRHNLDGVIVKITTDQKDVVENLPFERQMGMMVADFARGILDVRVRRGDPPFVFFSPETEELLKELHEITAEADANDEIRTSNENRLVCPHYMNGYCVADKDGNAPVFGCRHYCRGNCVEIKKGA